MADTFARAAFTYDVVPGSSAPIVSTFDFAIGTPVGASEVAVLHAELTDAWDNNVALVMSSTSQSGHLDLTYVTGSVVIDLTGPLSDGIDTVHDVAWAGASFRVIKDAVRPPRGKPGSFYIGGLRENYDYAGAIDPTVYAGVQGHMDDFFSDLSALTDFAPVVRRNVGGSPTRNDVLSLSVAPTMTFMQRRYR